MANLRVFEDYFRRADVDKDGRISGTEAVSFFQGANLPQVTLAKIWQFADQGQTGFLSKLEFYNALKLVTVAQTGRELTQEIVRAALAGPAAAQIPAPHIVTSGSPSSSYGVPSVPRQTAPSSLDDQFSSGAGATPKSWSSQATTLPVSNSSPSAAIPRPGSASGQRTPGSFSSDTWPSIRSSSALAPPSIAASVAPMVPNYQAGGNSGTPSEGKKEASVGQGLQSVSDSFFSTVNAARSLSSTFASSTLVDAFESDRHSASPKTTVSQGLADFGDGRFRGAESATRTLVPTSVTSRDSNPEVQELAGPLLRSSTAVVGQGFSTPSPTGTGLGDTWPRMTPSDAQRYSRVFAEVDTDRDGKITGEQARDLFLSWRLPREVLKQVWDLSDQDGDSMLSMREFCTALYLMERYREGRPLPPVFPLGFSANDLQPSLSATCMDQTGISTTTQNSSGFPVPSWQQQTGVFQSSVKGFTAAPQPLLSVADDNIVSSGPIGDTVQAVQYKSKTPALKMRMLNQLSQDEQETLRSRHKDAEEADKKAYELDKEIMDYREKAEFYRSKLQEIILFKSRCENRLSEITERAAADKREMESLAKKYDERFKAAAEINSRLLAEEAAFQDIEEKKNELCNSISKIQQGGDANELLQIKADQISSDLDELKKTLAERGKRLGLNVKATIPTEQKFGWQPGLQENAAVWEEDWDKFDDEGFVTQDLVDDAAGVGFVVPKPGVSGDESSPFDDGLDFASTPKSEHNVEISKLYLSVSGPMASEQGSLGAGSDGSGRSGHTSPTVDLTSSFQAVKKSSQDRPANATKVNQRYANLSELQEDVLTGLASYSSTTNSFDQGPPLYNSGYDDAFGNGSGSWAPAYGHDDEMDSGVRASWGLQSNPPSTQVSLDVTGNQSSRSGKKGSPSHGFGESLEVGLIHVSNTDHIANVSSPTFSHHDHGNFCEEYDGVGPLGTSKDFKISQGVFESNCNSRISNIVFDSPKKSEAGNDRSFPKFDVFSNPQNSPAFSGVSENNEQDDFIAAGKAHSNPGFVRFDSFTSAKTDGGHERAEMFSSFDEGDNLFVGAGTFGAGLQDRTSDHGWRAF